MALLGITHVVDDMNQSALPALLPFLIAERGLSYTAAAGLMLFASLASSVVQPAIGHLADRRPMAWLIAAGVFLAGGGLALAGAMPDYWSIVACVAVSGLGIAAFHPEAARFANYAAGAKKATGMRWFALGGNVGFALGPLLLTPLLVAFGARGTLFVFDTGSADGARRAARVAALADLRRAQGAQNGRGRPRSLGAVLRPHRVRDPALDGIHRTRRIHPALLHRNAARLQAARQRRAHAVPRRGGVRYDLTAGNSPTGWDAAPF